MGPNKVGGAFGQNNAVLPIITHNLWKHSLERPFRCLVLIADHEWTLG